MRFGAGGGEDLLGWPGWGEDEMPTGVGMGVVKSR